MKPKTFEKVSCSFEVSRLEYQDGKDFYIKPGEKYELLIDYPFGIPKKFPVKSPSTGLTLARLLPFIRKAYTKMYADADKDDDQSYWHGVEDLAIEGITVDHKKKLITLEVGS